MLMRRARARRAAARAVTGGLFVDRFRATLGRFAFGIGALQVRGDRLRLRAAATRATAAAFVTAVTSGLGATLRAVGHGALADVVRLLAHGRLAARLGDRVRDGLGDELDRADRIVIAGDSDATEFRIGVRVHERARRDAELVRLGDGDLLLLRVDDEHEAWRTREGPDAAQILRELVLLARHHEALLLRVVLPLAALNRSGLELLHAAQLLLHRLEVGEQATEPSLGDVHRTAALGLLLHDAGDLRLRADEEDAVAAKDDVAHELLRQLELAEGLLQIDDVDPVALREDEAAHLGIPTARLMSEMDSCGEESFQRGLSVRHVWLEWLIRRRAFDVSVHRLAASAPNEDSERLRDEQRYCVGSGEFGVTASDGVQGHSPLPTPHGFTISSRTGTASVPSDGPASCARPRGRRA